MEPKQLIKGYIYYLRFERGFCKSTETQYVTVVTKWLATGLTAKEYYLNVSNRNETLAALKSWNHFQSCNGVKSNQWIAFAQYIKPTQKIPSTLSFLEIKDLIDKAGSKRNRAIIETLYATGLRISELRQLTLNDISSNVIKVLGKGQKERLVPIYTNCVAQLQSLSKNQGEPIFSISCDQINRIIKTTAIRAGIKKRISAHTLRHTYASHLYANGADLFSISDLLGHSNVTTTEIYVRTFTGHLRNSLQMNHPRW